MASYRFGIESKHGFEMKLFDWCRFPFIEISNVTAQR